MMQSLLYLQEEHVMKTTITDRQLVSGSRYSSWTVVFDALPIRYSRRRLLSFRFITFISLCVSVLLVSIAYGRCPLA